MATIQLDYVVPSPDLADYVTVFYRFAADVPLFEDVERADHAQFRFRLSAGAAGYRFAGGAEVAAPPLHLVAATTAAVHTRAEGPVRVFGVGLTPAGWAALVDPASRAPVVDATALFGDVVAHAAVSLAMSADAAAMAAIAEPLLRTLIGRGDPATLAFVAAVDAWLASRASPALAALEASTRLSRRQIERRCNALYGAPPKLLARKYRALRAAVALARDGASVDTLIADGFYDQSHLIRELKQFTGLTPGRIRAAPGLLAGLTIDGRTALRGQVGPLVSDT